METKSEVEPRTYSVPEAARILGIGTSLAYSLANSGGLPVIRLGGRFVVPREKLERLLADGGVSD